MMTFKTIRTELAHVGMTASKTGYGNEISVRPKGLSAQHSQAYFTDDLGDALATGMHMAGATGLHGTLSVAEATMIALRADRAWGDKLNELFCRNAGHVRYTPEGHGEPGSTLRALHDAKVEADRAMHAAFEASRNRN